MKLKKKQLKGLIKECLQEMFAEEFVNTVIQTKLDQFVALQLRESIEQAQQAVIQQPQQQYFTPQQQVNRQQMLREMAPDVNSTQQYNAPQAQIPQHDDLNDRMSKFKQTIHNVTHGDTPQAQRAPVAQQPARIVENTDSSSNMMQSIFADTAATTLQSQADAGKAGMGPGVNPMDPGIDISAMVNPNWQRMAGIK
jgi:hypothetical protein